MADVDPRGGAAAPGPTHRENTEELRERARLLLADAYRADAPWQLRDVAVPLVVDLLGELGAVVLELELVRAIAAANERAK